jgi:peptide subunit release factor 1 (eRF1)
LRTKEEKHTELISLYVAQGTDINKKIRQLQEEQATASNIKDKTTRRSVLNSLERIIKYLRSCKKECVHNGVAVFCGSFQKGNNRTVRM